VAGRDGACEGAGASHAPPQVGTDEYDDVVVYLTGMVLGNEEVTRQALMRGSWIDTDPRPVPLLSWTLSGPLPQSKLASLPTDRESNCPLVICRYQAGFRVPQLAGMGRNCAQL
jgi:hypothetical protein